MKSKALFLDRDGVINVEKNYVYRIQDFEFQPHVFEVLQKFQSENYLLIIITNQAGVAKGYYSEEDFHILNNWMLEQFQKADVNITNVYYCPFHLNGAPPYNQDSFNRKPNPGMIFAARDEFLIDLEASVLIGDQESDILAGINAGIKKNVLLTKVEQRGQKTLANGIIHDISELVMWL
ncbi:D-glycero-alpha-D-manno-heptose-1,7-bisphosphate 7-phosphatase [Paenibacillus alba]|uniref:D,D-heptose 1,7-bisphosphate phosphatase n=1 Tax=Paenibacillus alba TaxID=1197127 RepID=A0ABU6G594_9BACL|nr:HAD family hydrolase [Paenibacillus alba]MEC0227949.1 HAD family hydrolase [Paenibacillus alba]